MTQKHSTQINRDNERFTQYAITCRDMAYIYGVQATHIPTYATPVEVMDAVRLHAPTGNDFTLPAAPKLTGSYEGDKGTTYSGPSKRTLKRRASRAMRSA